MSNRKTKLLIPYLFTLLFAGQFLGCEDKMIEESSIIKPIRWV